MRLEDIDLNDPEAYVDGVPHAAFAKLRRESPVHWHPERVKPSISATFHREAMCSRQCMGVRKSA